MNAILEHLKGKVDVQTPGRTSVGDIILTQEKDIAELRVLTKEMKRDLMEYQAKDKTSTGVNEKTDTKKKKGPSQKDKKRKREEILEKDDTEDDDEASVNDGEKIFLKSRSSKAHYLEILKEIEYIKEMPPALLLLNMKD